MTIKFTANELTVFGLLVKFEYLSVALKAYDIT